MPEKGIVATFVDKAIGMDEEDLSEIFQPFLRTKDLDKYSKEGSWTFFNRKIV